MSQWTGGYPSEDLIRSDIENAVGYVIEDNSIMRHCIEKFDFSYCGVIYLLDGDPRLAYQKIRKSDDFSSI